MLAVVAASLSAATPANADGIAAKRRQAARLADSIDALGERISILDEDFNSATFRLAHLELQARKAAKGTVKAERRLNVVEGRLQARSVREYISPSSNLAEGVSGDLNDAGTRDVLRSIATNNDDAVLEDLRAAREDLMIHKRSVVNARSEARALSVTPVHSSLQSVWKTHSHIVETRVARGQIIS